VKIGERMSICII